MSCCHRRISCVRAAALGVVLAMLLVSMAAPLFAKPREQDAKVPPERLHAFAVTYSDGRTTYTQLSRGRSGFWTGLFPRIPGASTDRDGLQLSAIDFAVAPDGDAYKVAISLRYGTPHQRQLPVKTVRVTLGQSVRVEDLKAYGVMPVTVSVVPAQAMGTFVPATASVSTGLDVRVEPTDDGAAYRGVVTNTSSRALVAFEVQAYDGSRLSLSTRRRGTRHEVLARPGGRDEFVFRPSGTVVEQGGQPVWRLIDRVAITSVLWDDGVVEGDPVPAALEKLFAVGTARQLKNIIAALRLALAATEMTPSTLAGRLDALAIVPDPGDTEAAPGASPDHPLLPPARRDQALRMGMQMTKEEALKDLAAFQKLERASDGSAFQGWLTQMIADYSRWLERANNRAGQQASTD